MANAPVIWFMNLGRFQAIGFPIAPLEPGSNDQVELGG